MSCFPTCLLFKLTRMCSKGSRCFNCGSPEHIVAKCSEPLNRPLIALSRAMHGFFKDTGNGEPERFHEYEERRTKRLRFAKSFQAGSICGELLREALGIDKSESNEGEERVLPWLWRMLEWGYPPGWVSEEDPKLKILARIEGEDMWADGLDAAIIFDNQPQTSNTEHLSAYTNNCANAKTRKAPTDRERTNSQKHWVHYPTTLFSSEHLVVYSGTPLTPLIYSGSSPVVARKEHGDAVPPWCRPRAFSAFGPDGWQDYINQENTSMLVPRTDSSTWSDCNDEKDVEISDMDLSE